MNIDIVRRIAEDIQDRLKALHYRHSDKPFHAPGTFHIANSILQTLGLADGHAQEELSRWFPLSNKDDKDESSINVPAEESSPDPTNSNEQSQGRDRRQNTNGTTDNQHPRTLQSSLRSSSMGEAIPPLPQKVEVFSGSYMSVFVEDGKITAG
jgi:hypothetical protein